MATTKIKAGYIDDGAVGTAQIADNAITAAKIANGVIGTVDIADGSVTSAKLASGAVATTLSVIARSGAVSCSITNGNIVVVART